MTSYGAWLQHGRPSLLYFMDTNIYLIKHDYRYKYTQKGGCECIGIACHPKRLPQN